MLLTRKILFIPGEDKRNDFGEDGYYVEGCDLDLIQPCVNGTNLAHDLVEHLEPEEIGGVPDECLAIGRYLYGRWQCDTKCHGNFHDFTGLMEDFEDRRLIPYSTHNPSEEAQEILDTFVGFTNGKVNPSNRIHKHMLLLFAEGIDSAVEMYGNSHVIFSTYLAMVEQFDSLGDIGSEVTWDTESGRVLSHYHLDAYGEPDTTENYA